MEKLTKEDVNPKILEALLGADSNITVDEYVDALAEAFLIRTSIKFIQSRKRRKQLLQ